MATSLADLRRLAIQVATLLPDDRCEALRVLELTKEFVVSFLARPDDYERPRLAIVSSREVAIRRGSDDSSPL